MEIEQQNDIQKSSIDDFLLISVIGKGAYAKVVLVRRKKDQKVLALKILKKRKVENHRFYNQIMNEKKILIKINHPFIVKLYQSFQNDTKLFFLLEFCPGGELFTLIQYQKKFKEEQALFYSAQILLALNHLHENDIIYKDLKPENILIDLQGYIKLTDFGLSEINVNDNQIFQICGTPEYLAPEVLNKTGHDKRVDWWTFGCIIFEMLTGLPPFYYSDRTELFEKIKYEQLVYPQFLSSNVINLLEGLLRKDPRKRFAFNEIKNHIWFSNIDWKALMEKRITSPFIPQIDQSEETKYFDNEFTDLPINSLSAQESFKQNMHIKSFTYNNTFESSFKSYNNQV